MELNFIIIAIICLKSSQLNFNFHLKSCANSDLHTGLECIRSYTRRCMSQHEREHFNKLYFGTNEMIKDLCSEGAYQEGTYVIFNLIKIQFTRNCISFKFLFDLILFYYTFNFERENCFGIYSHSQFPSWQISSATRHAWERLRTSTRCVRIRIRTTWRRSTRRNPEEKLTPHHHRRPHQRRHQLHRDLCKLA